MTFCLGMRCHEGLIALADTRITSGNETSTAGKISIHHGARRGRHALFIMTSGLRSVRDKALAFYEEVLDEREKEMTKVFHAVDAFAKQVRRVQKEDHRWLKKGGLPFDIHALVGGQLERDDEHKLFLIYPEGNWVEVSLSTPYFIIGQTGYGKPLLDRAFSLDVDLETAFKLAILSFDATRTSATDVDLPIDVVMYRKDSFKISERRFDERDLKPVMEFWNRGVRKLVSDVPANQVDRLFTELEKSPVRKRKS